MNLKEQLLNPAISLPVTAIIFDREFLVSKLTTAKLTEIDERMNKLRDSGAAKEVNLYTAEIILSALVDEKGLSMIEEVKPQELLELYDPAAINDALTAVYNVNYAGSSGEDAAKKD